MKRISTLLGLALLLTGFISNAQILQGTRILSTSNNMTLTVTVNTNTNVTEISISGPNNNWHSVGFGGSSMSGTYAMVMNGIGTVQERDLGNYSAGSALASSLTTNSSTTSGAVRTTVITRPRVGTNANYFTFPNSAGSFSVIWARGSGTNLNNHGGSNRGSTTITLADICNLPVNTLPKITACQGDSVFFMGSFKSVAGVYSDTLTTTAGCDSIVAQELELTNVDNSITIAANVLSAVQTGAAYQWYDCSNDSLLAGETSQTYAPSMSGSYKVEVTLSNCVVESNCLTASIGLEESFLNNQLSIYPNPSNGIIEVELENQTGKLNVEIFNLQGQKLLQETMTSDNFKLDLSHWNNGTYILRIEQDGRTYHKNFILSK